MAIVPAFNEEGRIGKTLTKLLDINEVNEICVIDDGSTDATLEVAKKYPVTVLSHNKNSGKGKAIRTGIDYFLQTDFDLAIFIDADGQHDPNDIPKFVRHFQRYPNYDIVVASRFGTDQWTNNMPFLRKISNLLSRFGIWILYNGLVIEDPQNGYRAYSREVLENIEFKTTGYEAETEMLIDSYLMGFEIGRIHIESIYDEEGNASKFSLLMDTWKIPGVMVKSFFRRRPFILRTKDRQIKYRQIRTKFHTTVQG